MNSEQVGPELHAEASGAPATLLRGRKSAPPTALVETVTKSADAANTGDTNLRDPALYLNRELAQLEFNFRVLAQAQDARIPLLERMRFLCISNSNLDEFFEVQVAILRHHLELGDAKAGPDGLPASELLARIRTRVLELVNAQYSF